MGKERTQRPCGSDVDGRLRPPPRPREWIRRPILLGPEPITCVSGPAGSGKTTLLTQWHEELLEAGEEPAWLTLGVKETAPEFIQRWVDEARTRMRDQDRHSGVVLFIDQIDTDLSDFFAGLVRNSDPDRDSVHLVLAGRPDLGSALSPLHSDIRTLGFDDLRFDDDETDRVLRASRADLGPWHCQRLVEQIDGWAFATDVAVRLLEMEGDWRRSALAFSGRDREICDYLETEVMSGLSPSDQDFLLQISVLESLTDELCEAVTLDDEAAERLHRLGRLNAMLTPAGPDRYRWMGLPREFAASRLERSDPERARRNRRRAHDWYVDNERFAEAIDYAAKNTDVDRVATVARTHGMDVLASGQPRDVLRWLSELPAQAAESDAWIGIVGAAAHWIRTGWEATDEIEDWLDTAAFAVSQSGTEPDAPSMSLVDITRAMFLPLDPVERCRLARRALDTDRDLDPSWRALGEAALGIAAFASDDTRAAREALTRCLSIQSGLAGTTWITPMITEAVVATLALIEMDEGEPLRAEGLVSAARLVAASKEPPGPMFLACGRLARHRDDPTGALEYDEMAAQSSRLIEYRTIALLEAASVHHELGRTEACHELVQRADELIDGAASIGDYALKRRRNLDDQIRHRRDDNAELTERELEVLQMLATDLSRREIGEHLFIAHNTVKTYVRRLYAKLEVSSRPAAVAQARENGWL